jgi:2-iminoacetate synthase ThiH
MAQMGGRSTCTMLFGHVESLADRVDHLRQLRELQDETHGFVLVSCRCRINLRTMKFRAVSADRFRYFTHDCNQPDLPRQF